MHALSKQGFFSFKQDSPAEELMNGLNLIILIVGEYFEQSDLVDPV